MKKIYAFVITRVLLALVFAGIIAVLKGNHFIFGGFKTELFTGTLFWISLFIAALLLSAIRGVLLEINRRQWLPGKSTILDRAAAIYARWITSLHERLKSLRFQFLLWGAVLVVILGLTWQRHTLDGKLSFKELPSLWSETASRQESRVITMPYFSEDNNQKRYLTDCLKIVSDLKKSGVKAVLITLPSLLSSTYEEQKRLNETGIVVFGLPRTTSVAYDTVQAVPKPRVGYLTALRDDQSAPSYNPVRTVEPVVSRPTGWSPKEIYDASFEVLRVYLGIPNNERPHQTDSHVLFGDLRFPVDEYGYLHIGEPFLYEDYSRTPISAARYPSDTPLRIEKGGTQEDYKNLVEGKVVILDWSYVGTPRPSYWQNQMYAQIIDDLIKGKPLTKARNSSFLLAVFCVALCGFVLYSGKPLTVLASILLFTSVILFGWAWLLQEVKVLLEISYPIAALFLSLIVFSSIRVARWWSLGGT